MRLPLTALLAGLLAATAPGGPAAGNPLKSQYTTIELAGCRIVKRHPDGNAWSCPGLPGYPIYFAEGDLRTFVSYGPAPEKRRAASQTPPPFNSILRGKPERATVEWRTRPAKGKALPHATILRYFVTKDRKKGQILVVSKVSDTESCHVAYIDALAEPAAIALARRIADEVAPKFDCSKEPTREGAKGKSPL